MSIDEQPDGDPHGECAFEIARLEKELAAMTAERDELRKELSEFDPHRKLHALEKECAELRNLLRQVYQCSEDDGHWELGTDLAEKINAAMKGEKP